MFYRSVSWISLAVRMLLICTICFCSGLRARVLRGPMAPSTPGQARIERRIWLISISSQKLEGYVRARRCEREPTAAVRRANGLQQILKGSQSSSRAQFFYVAKPTEEGTKRGGCQVVKGAGLRTLSRRCSRVRLPSPALNQLYNLSHSLYG